MGAAEYFPLFLRQVDLVDQTQVSIVLEMLDLISAAIDEPHHSYDVCDGFIEG